MNMLLHSHRLGEAEGWSARRKERYEICTCERVGAVLYEAHVAIGQGRGVSGRALGLPGCPWDVATT